jgi:2,5-diketo-D-gluconate reductase A
MLSWHWQEGAPPSLSQPSHRIAESFDVSDFDLTDAEPAAVDPIDVGTRGGPEPDEITMEAFGRESPKPMGPLR